MLAALVLKKKKKKKLRSLESHLRSLPNLRQGIKNIKTSSNARHLLGELKTTPKQVMKHLPIALD
jgi:hypothetical protein